MISSNTEESDSLVEGLCMVRQRAGREGGGWGTEDKTSIPRSYLFFSLSSCISHASMRRQDRSALLYVLPYAAESGAASGVMCLLTSVWCTMPTPIQDTHTHILRPLSL